MDVSAPLGNRTMRTRESVKPLWSALVGCLQVLLMKMLLQQRLAMLTKIFNTISASVFNISINLRSDNIKKYIAIHFACWQVVDHIVKSWR